MVSPADRGLLRLSVTRLGEVRLIKVVVRGVVPEMVKALVAGLEEAAVESGRSYTRRSDDKLTAYAPNSVGKFPTSVGVPSKDGFSKREPVKLISSDEPLRPLSVSLIVPIARAVVPVPL